MNEDHTALRAGVTRGAQARVDQEKGTIRDVSVIEAGPALGHSFDNDTTTLRQVLELGNRTPRGIKARLSHPDACNDGTGRELGRMSNFRYADDSGRVLQAAAEPPEGATRVLADFTALDAARRAPEGDLVGWLLATAQEDPAIIGLSIHGTGKVEKRLDAEGEPLVVDGIPARPVLRLNKLLGVDVVDEPAANRSGLFAASSWASSELEAAFADVLDDQAELASVEDLAQRLATRPALVALATQGDTIRLSAADAPVELDRAAGFLNRFLGRHGVSHPTLDAAGVRRILASFQESHTMNENDKTTAAAPDAAKRDEKDTSQAKPPVKPDNAPDVTAAEKAGRKAEAERQTAIRALGALFPDTDLRETIAQACADPEVSLDQARQKIIEKLSTDGLERAPVIEAGPTASQKLAQQAADAICLAHQIPLRNDDGPIEQRTREASDSGLRGMGPKQLARISLGQAGVRGTDRMTDERVWELAMGAFARQSAGNVMLFAGVGHSTGDFPLILSNSAYKAMIGGYMGTPVTWDRWCRIGNLRNFQTHDRLRLSEAPLLDERTEGEPAQQGTFNEQREQITLKNYAKAVSYTRQMFLNDDLGAFMTLSQKMGAGANHTIEFHVYTNLTLNSVTGPTMGDGVVLFHANHANLLSNGAPSQANLEALAAGMMNQAGIGQDGTSIPIGAAPRFWLGPPIIAMAIEKIIRSDFAGSDARRDPQLQMLADAEAIKVPMLNLLGATTQYFAVAPQALAPSYEVGFLNGERSPRTKIENHTTVDGVTVVVDQDFAVHPTGGWQGIAQDDGV